eukprot:m.294007 g.294007  ORF g.294007 m.294007 type:complete len:466 (+) comp12907_c0_seq1:181-1578(+)
MAAPAWQTSAKMQGVKERIEGRSQATDGPGGPHQVGAIHIPRQHRPQQQPQRPPAVSPGAVQLRFGRSSSSSSVPMSPGEAAVAMPRAMSEMATSPSSAGTTPRFGTPHVPLSQRRPRPTLAGMARRSPASTSSSPVGHTFPKQTYTPLPDVLSTKGGLGILSIEGEEHSCAESEVEDCGLLGRGQFGTVCKMRHKRLDKFFAVKMIRDSMETALREQLLTDLEVIKRCKSEHIVSYFGYNFTEGEIWIFMELLRCSLEDLYKQVREKHKHLSEDVMGVIAASMLKGLHYLKTSQNIMHRDVKPSNVLLGFDGAIKLCDFGVSKIMEKSISRTAVGCERYLPPERLDPETSRDPYDTRSDVWAFGVTLVEIAQLKYPYPDGNMFTRLTAIVTGDPPKISSERYSGQFASFVDACLQKDKRLRPKYSRRPEMAANSPSLLEHPFYLAHKNSEFDLAAWYHETLETD